MWFWRDNAASDMAGVSDEDARLERAMRKVPRLDRQLFLTHRLDDLSYAAIAEATGLSPARVEKAILRTMIILDRELSRSTEPRA